ncbi:MAG: GNAT family N-acetyltransferase, partial [Candidatus Binatia bacterium]
IWEALQAANTYTSTLFTYLFEDPFDSLDAVRAVIAKKVADPNTRTYAILKHDISGHHKAVGMASLMRMDLPHKVIEVGSILYTPSLQRTPAATEAMYLLATYVFETLGMRRYEWKCHSKNAPSRRAAARYGFTYEGIFRQHMILKGQSRDTAWFAMIDEDWPALKAGFERWLAPDNFDANWRQFKTLEQCREV